MVRLWVAQGPRYHTQETSCCCVVLNIFSGRRLSAVTTLALVSLPYLSALDAVEGTNCFGSLEVQFGTAITLRNGSIGVVVFLSSVRPKVRFSARRDETATAPRD
jgi:hypothetical protein